MPPDLPRPLPLAPPAPARGSAQTQTRTQTSTTERVVLQGWILALVLALLWTLLS